MNLFEVVPSDLGRLAQFHGAYTAPLAAGKLSDAKWSEEKPVAKMIQDSFEAASNKNYFIYLSSRRSQSQDPYEEAQAEELIGARGKPCGIRAGFVYIGRPS